MVRSWKQALFLVQPETLLRWHRELFRVFWKHKSKARSRKSRLSPETISLIKEMAADNRLWGAERIRGDSSSWIFGEVKRTIQKYMKQVRPKRARGQTWKMFLRHHAAEIWACDFLQVTDLFFRPLFAFFIIELKSRKVIHVNVTRTPPISGSHNSCEKQLPMEKSHAICFEIMTAHSGRVLRAWR
jgi:putative transposase